MQMWGTRATPVCRPRLLPLFRLGNINFRYATGPAKTFTDSIVSNKKKASKTSRYIFSSSNPAVGRLFDLTDVNSAIRTVVVVGRLTARRNIIWRVVGLLWRVEDENGEKNSDKSSDETHRWANDIFVLFHWSGNRCIPLSIDFEKKNDSSSESCRFTLNQRITKCRQILYSAYYSICKSAFTFQIMAQTKWGNKVVIKSWLDNVVVGRSKVLITQCLHNSIVSFKNHYSL